MKVVLAEKVSPATLAVFQTEQGWNVLTHDQVKNLPEALADADALVVRSAVQVDDALMAAAPKLRVIGRAGVGVDNIDADAATRRGIVVMNTPGANAIAVAELAIGLMISLARQIPKADATMHAGKWEKKSLQGVELRGKKLGILGLGRIGIEVARRARSFGMELLGHDPFVSASIARENGIRLISAEELFSLADYLTLHVGLTPQTTGIINSDTLATMKKGVRIVNCARGELVVEKDLAEALASGHVAGAALDVFHEEPLKNSPFTAMDNALLTPHIAGSTAEAQEAVGVQIALQVREYLKSGVVQNAVNLPSLSHEEYEELAPYMTLAERLGTFLAQFPKGSIDSIQIKGGAGSVLKLSLHTSEASISASASVLHGTSPRLLNLDGIDIEAPLQGTLLAIRNKDVPGVIGRIGTILGEHQINIANFALGRADAHGAATALAVLQIDGEVTDAVLKELRAVPAITGVRQVTL
jgi:D-3-phosphoglycerate dehydrogenase